MIQPAFPAIAVSLSRRELALLGAFVALSALDAYLTVGLVKNSYLVMELSPLMRMLFTVWGPPHYSFGVFWAVKMAITVGCLPVIIVGAAWAPRMRGFIFAMPVCILAVVCFVNSTMGAGA